MQGKRGGRVQVNMMQYMELVERVEGLEAIVKNIDVAPPVEAELTKPNIMKALDNAGVKYNPRDKKEVLSELLSGVEICQDDQTELD
jgi:hypothetical protein